MKNASIEGNKSLRFAMFKCLNAKGFPQVQFAQHLFQNYLFFDSIMGSGGIQIRIRIVFTVYEEKK
jgi:hypothetical protein